MKVKVTRKYINNLKAEIVQLQEENRKLKEDVKKFRRFFRNLLKENISMISKQQYYTASTMVEKLSELMNDVSSWFWGYE